MVVEPWVGRVVTAAMAAATNAVTSVRVLDVTGRLTLMVIVVQSHVGTAMEQAGKGLCVLINRILKSSQEA